MSVNEYYKILELQRGCSVEEIKKAYRKKAREYHPDINQDPSAKDLFILATEAYEFLLTYSQRIQRDTGSYARTMEDWRRYRQAMSRQRARAYAQTSYMRFRSTKFYRTTRIFDGTTIIFSLVISIMVLFIAIAGYFYRIHHPIPGLKDPSIWVLISFVAFGMFLFVISFVYLKAYIQSLKKHKTEP